MATTIWKPATNDGNPAFLTDINNPRTPPVLVLPNGQRVTGNLKSSHEGRHKWTFPPSVLGVAGAHIEYNGQQYPIENTSTSYEGSGPNWQARAKGSLGAGGFSGNTGGFGTVGAGQYGVAPQFIGDQFPAAQTTNYTPIKAAPYQYIDPLEFGKYFNTAKREELGSSFDQGGDFARKALDTELSALTNFVPKSSALKRTEIAADNTFNQGQRTTQVNAAVPDVAKDLNAVAADARTYASGEVPNAVVNKGLEIGVRSAAADVAASSGFGVGSSAARKVSDLMSARERIQLSQYGEGLLSENAGQRTNLFLAPTQYSDAGSQIRSTPSLSGSQLQIGSFSDINNSLGVRGESAFSTNVQQSQFLTQLLQRTSEYNATNTLQNAQFNATNLNNFALSYFSYLNSYVNSLAGAAQTNANAGVAQGQQDAANQAFNDSKDDTQNANDIGTIGQTIGVIGGALALSDSRLKENVILYQSGRQHIDALRVVEYNYKDGTIAADGRKKHIGVIAQELQKVFPNSVGKHSSGFLQIDPSELIYTLIQAVQELAKEVTALKEKNG